MKKKSKNIWTEVKGLAVKQGYITVDQIESRLEMEASIKEMDELFIRLNEININWFDSEDEALRQTKKARRQADKKDETKALSAQVMKYDDPVRMYLREMGKVPLLDRQGEIEIAKRIEQGQEDVIQTVFKSASSVKELQSYAQRVDKEKMSLDDFVRVETGGFGPSGQPPVRDRKEVTGRVRKIARAHSGSAASR